VVGVNIGANRDSADRAEDYVRLIETFAPVASYFTVNVSSPNTPGLRDLQQAGALDDLRRREADRARHEAATAEQAEAIATELRKTVLRFEVQSGPTGTLFGSVTPTDIADELWRAKKIRVDRRKIGIDPIKRIGRYEVPVDVFQDVRVEVKTLVVPEGGELPSDEELAEMEAAERVEQEAETPEPEVELEEILAEVDAAEAAEGAEAQAAEAGETEAGETEEPEAEAEPEPDWRADADAALAEE